MGLSRSEEYLQAAIDNTGTENIPEPQSRIEELLQQLCDILSNSGGSSSSSEVTLTDATTGVKYRLGVENGSLFIEAVE